jgi:hypothetical protein
MRLSRANGESEMKREMAIKKDKGIYSKSQNSGPKKSPGRNDIESFPLLFIQNPLFRLL